MEDDLTDAWEGNRRRQLWKSACTRSAINVNSVTTLLPPTNHALQPNISENDRILYAALVPTPQTSSVLKTACRTWEDHLWAQISVVCEEKQSTEMLRVGGSFWEGGLPAVESGVRVLSPDAEEAESEEWEEEVRGSLEILKTVAVQEGYVGSFFRTNLSSNTFLQPWSAASLPLFATADNFEPNRAFDGEFFCRRAGWDVCPSVL